MVKLSKSRRPAVSPYSLMPGRLTRNPIECTVPFVTQETENKKTAVGKLIKLRRRTDGVVVFYEDGCPRMGVREGPKTESMFEAIEAALADAVALDVSI